MENTAFFEEQFNGAVKAKGRLGAQLTTDAVLSGAFLIVSFLTLPHTTVGIIQLLFCIVFFYFSRRDFLDGLKSFLRLRPTTDSFPALCMLAQVMLGIGMVFSELSEAHTVAPVLFFAMTASQLMKYLFTDQLVRNLDVVRRKNLSAVYTQTMLLSRRAVNKICTVEDLNDFPDLLRRSLEDDLTARKNRKFILFAALGCLLLSILCGILHPGAFLPALAALTTVGCSFTAEACFAFPYLHRQRKLLRDGSILLGNYSVEELATTDALLLKDTDLFPPEENEIVKVQVTDPKESEKVLRYTSAILHQSQSPMEQSFNRYFPDWLRKMPKILQWRELRNYGVIANIDFDSVLFGNRNLLISHNIQPWTPEREAMLVSAGVSLMYLVINGKIAALMVFRYQEDESLRRRLESFGTDFHIVVQTRDCNITDGMIARRFDLINAKIIVPDPEEEQQVAKAREALNREDKLPVMLSTEGALGMLNTIKQMHLLKRSTSVLILVQQIMTVFGILTTTVALLLAPGRMTALWPLVFQLIWIIPVLVLTYFDIYFLKGD